MKHTYLMLAALIVGSAAVGCNSSSTSAPANPEPAPAPVEQPAPQPATPPAPQPPQGWTLKLQSKCAAEIGMEQCVAGHGFTVDQDGKYTIGPTAQGQTKTGTLAPEELKTLTDALSPTLSASELSAENHLTLAAEENPSEDTVTFARGPGEGNAILHSSASDLTYRTQSGDQAKALLTSLKTLAVKYYTLPFPDGCTDNVTALNALFASMQTCTADSECSYFDNGLNVIDPASYSFLTTDDCTLVKPLTVGNAKLVNSNMEKLAENLNQVQLACGNRYYRMDCNEIGGFQLNGAPAVCKQGVCQANQASSTPH